MKTRMTLILGLLILMMLALGAGASAASVVPPQQEGPPEAEAVEAAPDAVLAPYAPVLRLGPYVQNVAKTSADILWEADGTPATTYLHFRKLSTTTWTQYTVTGTNVNQGTGKPAKYIYKQSLAGLLANTKYEFQISINGTTWTPTTVPAFITAPGASTAYVAADWGDSQPHREYPNALDMTRFNTLLTKMVSLAPRIAMTTGDRIERGKCYEDWKPDYFDPVTAKRLLPNTCVFPAAGNHEDDIRGNGNCAANTQLMWYDKYFTWPGKVEGTHWYAYTYGCVRYVVLDTTVAYESGTAQYNWLVTELKSTAFTSAKWQIVLMHYAPYTCTNLDTDADRQKLHKYLDPLFTQYGVDMVISGHRHSYERSLVNGIPYIVSAGGNAPLYHILPACVDPANPNKCKPACNPYSAKYIPDWNFITLSLKCTDPSTLTMKAYGLSGAQIDTVTLTKATGTCKSFQNGVLPTATYAGNTDTFIHQHNPATNYGSLASINVDGDDPNGSTHDVNALLKWVIPSTDIPAGSTITSAKIDFWVSNHSGGQVYELYKVKSSWAEGTATWNVSPTWDTVVLGSMGPATAAANYTVDLNTSGKGVVQGWVNTPASNYGLVIRDSANGDGFDVDSSEGATLARRPKLTVCYNPPAASALTEGEVEATDVAVEEPEATVLYTGLNTFGGVTNQGLGDATTPLAGVSLSLYGRQEGEEAPGALLATAVSGDAGAFGFQATEPWLYDFFVLTAAPPAGLVSVGTWTIDGSMLGDGSVEWYRPQPDMYAGEFHFDVPQAPEEPLPEPEVTNYLWLPVINR